MPNPLATFIILAYKQEQYVREAVEGAFSQVYSPLEIILSDDRSPDGTFKIMEQMAAEYRGPHQVLLNQTPRNGGLSAHLDCAVKRARGEWIIIAAGDDISLPDRVMNHMRLARENPKAHSTFLAPVVFGDARGVDTVPDVVKRTLRYPETLRLHGGGILGATHAARRQTWEVFGDLGPGITCEDWVVAFRSSMLGEVVWDDCPGVRYRVHEQSITGLNFGTKVMERQLRIEKNALQQFAKDLPVAMQNGLVPADAGRQDLEWLARAVESNQQILDCLEADTFWKLVKNSGRMLVNPNFAVGNYRRKMGIVRDALRAGNFARGGRTVQANR